MFSLKVRQSVELHGAHRGQFWEPGCLGSDGWESLPAEAEQVLRGRLCCGSDLGLQSVNALQCLWVAPIWTGPAGPPLVAQVHSLSVGVGPNAGWGLHGGTGGQRAFTQDSGMAGPTPSIGQGGEMWDQLWDQQNVG